MIRIGFVPSHKAHFDTELAIEIKNRIIKSISENIKDIELIYPNINITKNGLVTTEEDSVKLINYFEEKKINGLIIGTLSFGEEIANLRIAEAFDRLPILVFGIKEGPFTPDGNRRSDSFCGTISTASGLIRRKINFDFAGIYFPEEEDFLIDIEKFLKVVSIYKNFIGARIGIVGGRPIPFETCVFNESSLIEKFRQRVLPFNMLTLKSDIDESVNKEDVKEIINVIKKSFNFDNVSDSVLQKIASFKYILTKYSVENNLSGFGIECWTAMQRQIGISPCASMGLLTDSGIMTACETDVHGVLTMLVQYNASLKKDVPHFIDWTIQNQEDENVFFAWHCGNAPLSLKCPSCKPQIKSHSLLGEECGYDKSFGTAEFQLKDGIVTISRLTEVDNKFKMLITIGETVKDNRILRGSWKWIKVKDLKKLYRTIIEQGFTHHASMVYGNQVKEISSFCKFAGIEVIIV